MFKSNYPLYRKIFHDKIGRNILKYIFYIDYILYLYLYNNINKVYKINEIDNTLRVVAKHVLFQDSQFKFRLRLMYLNLSFNLNNFVRF